MEVKRPYWQVIVSLIFSVIGTALFVLIGAKMLLYFVPFVIGWFIAFVANPLVCWLEKRLKIVKKLSSAVIIVIVLGGIIAIFYFAGSKLAIEIGSLISNVPELYQELETGLVQVGHSLQNLFNLLPTGVQEGWNTIVTNLDSQVGKVIGNMSEPTVIAAGHFAKKIPSILIGTIVTIISAYFFIAQREDVIVWSKSITPQPIQKRMTMVIDNMKYAVGGYFKAQFKIMLVVFAILLIGFGVMNVRYAVLLAILIAMLDFLPFFGTGAVMIPWVLYKVLVTNYKAAIGLFVIYAITQLVRQSIQPKLVGDCVGINPLLTLFLLYIGYKVGSVLGMIFAVPIGIIVINMYKAGAFDYILDDIKILIEGLMSLREPK
ncbi:MAG: sporulation integral membrane protein YtvI [Lachnospiraceae bacterium]